ARQSQSGHHLRRQLVREPVDQDPGEPDPRNARRSVAGAVAREAEFHEQGHPVPVFAVRTSMRMHSLAIGAAFTGCTLACAAPALAQTAAELFDQNKVQEIRLSVNSRDFATFRANTQLNTYYTADLEWKD